MQNFVAFSEYMNFTIQCKIDTKKTMWIFDDFKWFISVLNLGKNDYNVITFASLFLGKTQITIVPLHLGI